MDGGFPDDGIHGDNTIIIIIMTASGPLFRPSFRAALLVVGLEFLLLRSQALRASSPWCPRHRRRLLAARPPRSSSLGGPVDEGRGRRHVSFQASSRRPLTLQESASPLSDGGAAGCDPAAAASGAASAASARRRRRRPLVGRRAAAGALLLSVAASAPLPFLPGAPSQAASASAPGAATTVAFVDPSEAQVTDRVYMNVRVSRQDGTFYVRDDLPDTAENRVFQGRLVVGLFGKAAPTSVERFLSYVDPGDASQLDDNPPPTYGRSYFPALDPATGLLAGGAIPSLQLTEVGGSAALQYGGRLLPARLWIEPPADRMERVSHVRKGLLTHRVLDPTPAFGITTRSDTRELDGTHTVFGALAMDEGDAAEFLDIVRDLPTYSVDGPPPPLAGPAGDPAAAAESLVGGAAGAIFSAQRSFFRGTAKALGDTRLDKVYDGKLLRRIEVVRVGRLGK